MGPSIKADAIIVSAGKGLRFGGGHKKQFLSLAGRPVLAYTLDPFEASPLIRSIVLVVEAEDIDFCTREIVQKQGYRKVSQVIAGGRTRQDSVKNGIEAASREADLLLIHDGVRPFVTKEMIESAIAGALQFEAVVFAVPVKDTVKVVDSEGTILRTLERSSLYQVQTPQIFRASLIREAYQRAASEGFLGTDDASLVERMGVKVHILPGSYQNIKLTTPEDFEFARFLVEGKKTDRIGIAPSQEEKG